MNAEFSWLGQLNIKYTVCPVFGLLQWVNHYALCKKCCNKAQTMNIKQPPYWFPTFSLGSCQQCTSLFTIIVVSVVSYLDYSWLLIISRQQCLVMKIIWDLGSTHDCIIKCDTCLQRLRKRYLEKDSFDFTTVLSCFLIHYGVQDVFGRNTGISNALVAAHHPNENFWDAVLWLDKINTYHQCIVII